MAKGVKRSALELEAQDHLTRLRQIIDELSQDRRRIEAMRETLVEMRLMESNGGGQDESEAALLRSPRGGRRGRAVNPDVVSAAR